jgi:hypothetical protein
MSKKPSFPFKKGDKKEEDKGGKDDKKGGFKPFGKGGKKGK